MLATDSVTFQEQHSKFQQNQSGSASAWLNDLRKRGFETFSELGVPTTREEDWRFTNIAPYLNQSFDILTQGRTSDEKVKQLLDRATLQDDFYRLVFVNGEYSEAFSNCRDLPKGVILGSLADSAAQIPQAVEGRVAQRSEFEQEAFVALNTAFINDGAFLHVADGVNIDRPIHLVFLSSTDAPIITHPRNMLRIGKGSKATVIESYLGGEGDSYFTNAVTEIDMGDAAQLDHCKLQHEQLNAVHIATTNINLKQKSNFRSQYFSFGSSLARNQLNGYLDGEHIECTLNGLYMPTDKQLMDCRTRIDHAKPNCNSYELYKGILDDHARGVFNGKIYVHQDAQKTDAKQSNQALLLSDDAIIDTKPQLEIYADDVRCTHGATIGELDEKALYYLRARGIPKNLARKMLIFAFANDVVQGVEIPAVREHLESILLAEHGLPNV